jgi:hypothetical protein
LIFIPTRRLTAPGVTGDVIEKTQRISAAPLRTHGLTQRVRLKIFEIMGVSVF